MKFSYRKSSQAVRNIATPDSIQVRQTASFSPHRSAASFPGCQKIRRTSGHLAGPGDTKLSDVFSDRGRHLPHPIHHQASQISTRFAALSAASRAPVVEPFGPPTHASGRRSRSPPNHGLIPIVLSRFMTASTMARFVSPDEHCCCDSRPANIKERWIQDRA